MTVPQDDTLARLGAIIASRKGGDPDKSYVARLFSKGTDAILKKVGEEATEVVMAAKDGDRPRIVGEVADLWFHTMVALAAFDLEPADVLAELRRREGLSGLEEFALRKLDRRQAGEPVRDGQLGDESQKATAGKTGAKGAGA
jgi:phosphoribosyl-ATP pyrophosphohydrolase